MNDLISRQAAIDALQEEINKGIPPFDDVMGSIRCGVRLARNIIEDLPSAQPYTDEEIQKMQDIEQAQLYKAYEMGKADAMRWIPCSERLPENGHYYLWCSDMGHVQSDYYWNGFENGMKYGYNIVAWMPLPEPYTKRRGK